MDRSSTLSEVDSGLQIENLGPAGIVIRCPLWRPRARNLLALFLPSLAMLGVLFRVGTTVGFALFVALVAVTAVWALFVAKGRHRRFAIGGLAALSLSGSAVLTGAHLYLGGIFLGVLGGFLVTAAYVTLGRTRCAGAPRSRSCASPEGAAADRR